MARFPKVDLHSRGSACCVGSSLTNTGRIQPCQEDRLHRATEHCSLGCNPGGFYPPGRESQGRVGQHRPGRHGLKPGSPSRIPKVCPLDRNGVYTPGRRGDKLHRCLSSEHRTAAVHRLYGQSPESVPSGEHQPDPNAGGHGLRRILCRKTPSAIIRTRSPLRPPSSTPRRRIRLASTRVRDLSEFMDYEESGARPPTTCSTSCRTARR